MVLYLSILAVGGVELVIALLCLATRRVWLQLGLVAWLATNFLVYRLGLLWIGYHRPCGCLGNLTDALGISPKTADVAMKLVLAYLLVGSYAALYWLWQSSRQRPVTAKAVLTPVDSSPAPSA